MSFQQILHETQVTKLIDKLEELEDTTNDYLDSNMEAWYDEFIVEEIKRIATAMNLPQKFVDGVAFVKTGKNEGKVINTWGTQEKPLAKWFNDGTTNYDISSTGDWPLHWVSASGDDVYVSTKNKPVHHPGFPKTQAMEIGIQIGQKELQERARQETNSYLKGVAEQ